MHRVAGLKVKGACDVTQQSKVLPRFSAEALIHFTLPFQFWPPLQLFLTIRILKRLLKVARILSGCLRRYLSVITLEACYGQRSIVSNASPVRHVEPSLLLCRWLSPQLCRKSYLVLPANAGAAMSTQPSLRNLLVWKYHMCSHCLC